jgi:hypothetical protein
MSDLTPEERRQFARLVDESAIRSVITRYSNSVDWMNWPVLESLIWEDARIDFGDAFRGDRAAFMPFVKALEESYVRRMHSFSEARIRLDGSNAQAEVTAVMHVRALAAPSRTDNVVFGRYLLELQKRNGEWRLSSLYFMFNHALSATTTESDAGPLNSAENTTMQHPKAPKF